MLYPLSYGGSGAERAYMTERAGRSGVGTVHETDLATAADGGPDPGAEAGRVLRALVVDDTAPIRDLIAVNLELEGFEVIGRRRCRRRSRSLASWRPDVITLDVVMPRLDGFETLARLRADPGTAHIPIVMVTGRAQAADRARGEALGVDAYVTKPFEPAELVAPCGRWSTVGASGRRPPIRLAGDSRPALRHHRRRPRPPSSDEGAVTLPDGVPATVVVERPQDQRARRLRHQRRPAAGQEGRDARRATSPSCSPSG